MAARGRSLRLMEVFRTVFYTPIYVSVAGGFLESQGLDVTFRTRPPQFANVSSALDQGAADISGSGIMSSIISLDGGADNVPVHFAKINARDGFFILSRRTDAQFRWETLRGATVIPVGFSPMPPASFQFALRNHGVDPAELNLIPGLPLDEAVAVFRSGQGDFIHLPEPAASWPTEPASVAGPRQRAYSSFAGHRNPWTVLSRATPALTWLRDSEPETEMVTPFFSDVPNELIVRPRYKDQETWPPTPYLEEPDSIAFRTFWWPPVWWSNVRPTRVVRPNNFLDRRFLKSGGLWRVQVGRLDSFIKLVTPTPPGSNVLGCAPTNPVLSEPPIAPFEQADATLAARPESLQSPEPRGGFPGLLGILLDPFRQAAVSTPRRRRWPDPSPLLRLPPARLVRSLSEGALGW